MNFKIKPLFKLGKELRESSALEHYNDKFWSLNDGGNENSIYSFVPQKKSIIQNIKVHPSNNIDWESLAQDENYFYIGDIGDNMGRRGTLKIYLVPKDSLLKGNGFVSDSISFTFNEKMTDHSSKKYSAFDCEAISVIHDSIYLFTKNWHDQISSIYTIPTQPGHYNVSRSLTLAADLLVTGAGYCNKSGVLWLIGYKNYHPAFLFFPCFGSNKLGNNSFLRYDYPGHIGLQVEGIACSGNGDIYFSCEKTIYPARLYMLIRKD